MTEALALDHATLRAGLVMLGNMWGDPLPHLDALEAELGGLPRSVGRSELEAALHELGAWDDGRCNCGWRTIALWPRLAAAVRGEQLPTYADEQRAEWDAYGDEPPGWARRRS